MTVLITCDGYRIIRELTPADGYDLPVLCVEAERARADGYAVLASQDGRIVADAEGWRDKDSAPADPIMAAAERRYD